MLQKIEPENVNTKIEPIQYVKCRKCREEWTAVSINRYELCPLCHREAIGKPTIGDKIQRVILSLPEEFIRNWNGQLNSLPKEVQPQIKAALTPPIKIEKKEDNFIGELEEIR